MKEFYAVCEVVWAWLCGVAVRVREKASIVPWRRTPGSTVSL